MRLKKNSSKSYRGLAKSGQLAVCQLAMAFNRSFTGACLKSISTSSNTRFLCWKRLVLLFGVTTALASQMRAGEPDKNQPHLENYDVLTIYSLLQGTALARDIRNPAPSELLILPASPPEKNETSTDHEVNPPRGFFEECTPFRIGVSKEFKWHPKHWDQPNDIIIQVTREKNEYYTDGNCRKTRRPVRICLLHDSPIFALDKAQMQALITDFNLWLLNQARPDWLTSLLDPWAAPRKRYTAAFESIQASFWVHCLSPKEDSDARAIACNHFNLTNALGDPKQDWLANPKGNTNGMHLVWVSQGTTLEIDWGSDTGPFRRRGENPGLVAQFGRPTQAGSSLFPIGRLAAEINPFEPMKNISLRDDFSIPHPDPAAPAPQIGQSAVVPQSSSPKPANPIGTGSGEAQDSAAQPSSTPAITTDSANVQAAGHRAPVAPVDYHEKNLVPQKDPGENRVCSIFDLDDLYRFGEYYSQMISHDGSKDRAAALILARPINYLKEPDNDTLPLTNNNYADVSGVTQRFILCAFENEDVARDRFQKGWPSKSDPTETLPYAAGILGNHAFVRVLANLRVNGSALSVPLGTPLGDLVKPLEGEMAFGGSLVFIRNKPTATNPPFSSHRNSFVRITFTELPPESVLSQLAVAPLDSIELTPSQNRMRQHHGHHSED